MFLITESLKQALDAEGLAIVPKQPTAAMIEAANTAIENATDQVWDSTSDEMYGGLSSSAPFDIWKAMIEVATAPDK